MPAITNKRKVAVVGLKAELSLIYKLRFNVNICEFSPQQVLFHQHRVSWFT